MKCHFCGGTLKRGKVPYTLHETGFHLTIDAVKALVCVQCGELFFDQKTTEMLVTVGRQVQNEVKLAAR
ncbi:MAG: YgiT-type zinc finger protein [Myxococcota bacterium]